MGQKLLLLLDSDMTCDVKRLFSLWQRTVVLHAVRWFPTVCCCQTSSQEGIRSGVTPGRWRMLFWHSSLQKQMWSLFKYDHSHWRSRRVHLCFTVSSYLPHCINVRSKMWLPKTWGSISSSYYRTSRWISSFMHMSRSQTSECTTIL